MSEPYTLLLRLEGPMQSWGYRSRFDYRDTALEPTRSGVIGLICAAMGIARGEDISRFDEIRMGVRVDKQGRPERDYHTALNVIKADGTGTDNVQSHRDYLADSIFTVGLESDNLNLLSAIEAALNNPQWFLFLGRKSFCLSEHPLSASQPAIVRTRLENALEGAALSLRYKPRPGETNNYRLALEAPEGERSQHDWPICFRDRRFRPRTIHVTYAGGKP